MVVLFITHPDVIVDPAIPVPTWSLSSSGRAKMEAFSASNVFATLEAIWSSNETKAKEATDILGARLDLPVRIEADLRENDRSATGYLPPMEFERVADAFFRVPDASTRGWERARTTNPPRATIGALTRERARCFILGGRWCQYDWAARGRLRLLAIVTLSGI